MKRLSGTFSLLAVAVLWLSAGLTETGAQVLPTGPGEAAPTQPQGGLTGRIVYAGAGHGWTYQNDSTSVNWYTQRGVGQEMMEDYGNLDQFNVFVNYCFNAGATIVPMRPVGYQTNEVILDNNSPAVTWQGSWFNSFSTPYWGTVGDAVPYRFANLAASETATATYTPAIPVAGFYPVYTWVLGSDNRTSQLYRIRHIGGEATVRIPHHMVGSGWVYLGTYKFNAGSNPLTGAVVISNLQPSPSVGSVVIADAIRFGNGMGDMVPVANVAKTPTISGYPREEECARYWVQRSLGVGQSSALYDGGGYDGADSVGAPIRMAREMNREGQGGYYKRVYISFHSNAGGGRGVMGLYNNNSLFPGTGGSNQFRLAQLCGIELNEDMAAVNSLLEVGWSKRATNSVTFARSDFAFGEIRDDVLGREMDATIVETAFHDDASDAKLLRDPRVRRLMARSTYQALVRYFNEFDSGPLAFLPEPPLNVRARADDTGAVTITWQPQVAVGSGNPQGFVVHRSSDGYAFGNPVHVAGGTSSNYTFGSLAPGRDHYFRVAATNSAGESFQSETVGARSRIRPTAARVLVVNAFDRFERRLNPRQTPTALAWSPPGATGSMERVIPHLNNAFNYVVPHGEALSTNGVAFDSCQNETVSGGLISLMNYDAVVWACGNESTADRTFSTEEQALIGAYLDAGGNLFLSGSEIGWDLDRTSGPTAGDRAFIGNRLRARLNGDINDDSQTRTFSVSSGGIFANRSGGSFGDATSGGYNVAYPDVLTPNGTGTRTALSYSGGVGGAAAIQYDGTAGGGRVVFFGFPFETLLSPDTRSTYISDIMRFFGTLEPPALAVPEVRFSPESIVLTWTAIPGKRYRVQFKTTLVDGPWINLGQEVTADSTRASFVDAPLGIATQRYYRVSLVD